MKCSVCGRMLRNSQSMELGYGPVCYKRKFGFPIRVRQSDKISSSVGKIPDYNTPGQITIEEYLREAFGE